MEQEIKDIIAKNLPAQVGATLQQELARIPMLEAEIKKMQNSLSVQTQMTIDSNKERDELRARQAKWVNLEEREAMLRKAELALDNTILKMQVEEANKRATELHGIVQTVFKSPVYRKNLFNYTHYDNGRTTIVPSGEEATED